MKEEFYPAWICASCAKENGGHWADGHISTVHMEICGWCDKEKTCSSPRNWGFPEYKEEK